MFNMCLRSMAIERAWSMGCWVSDECWGQAMCQDVSRCDMCGAVCVDQRGVSCEDAGEAAMSQCERWERVCRGP